MKHPVSRWAKGLTALAFAVAYSATSWATPTPTNWLDAKISQYTEWPTTTVSPIGGTWSASTDATTSLDDMATLEAGKLAIDTQDGSLEFNATTPTALDNASVDIASTMEFVPAVSIDDLPAAADLKAGVAVITNVTNGTMSYYIVAKGETVNEWQEFVGYEGTVTLAATVAVNFAIDAGVTKATYTINGGSTVVTVADIAAINGVAYNGCGTVASLTATATYSSFPLTIDVAALAAKGLEVTGVTADGEPVTGVENVYAVPNGAAVVITFGAKQYYVATGAMTKTIDAFTGAMTIDGSTAGLPVVAEKWFRIGAQKYETTAAALEALAEATGDVVFEMCGDWNLGNNSSFNLQGINAEATSLTFKGANGGATGDWADKLTVGTLYIPTVDFTIKDLSIVGTGNGVRQFMLQGSGAVGKLLTFDGCKLDCSVENSGKFPNNWLVKNCVIDMNTVADPGRGCFAFGENANRSFVTVKNCDFVAYGYHAINLGSVNATAINDNTLYEFYGNTFRGNVGTSAVTKHRPTLSLQNPKRLIIEDNDFYYSDEQNGAAIGFYGVQLEGAMYVINKNRFHYNANNANTQYVFGKDAGKANAATIYFSNNEVDANLNTSVAVLRNEAQTQETEELGFTYANNLPASIASYLEENWADAAPVMDGEGAKAAGFPQTAGTYYVKPGCAAPAAPTGCTVEPKTDDSAISYALTLDEYGISFVGCSSTVSKYTVKGATVPLTADEEADGYRFVNFTATAGNVNENVLTIAEGTTGAITVTANYEKITYTIAVTYGKAEPAEYQISDAPQTIELTANNPASGYKFSNWTIVPATLEASLDGNNLTIPAGYFGPIAITANYVEDSGATPIIPGGTKTSTAQTKEDAEKEVEIAVDPAAAEKDISAADYKANFVVVAKGEPGNWTVSVEIAPAVVAAQNAENGPAVKTTAAIDVAGIAAGTAGATTVAATGLTPGLYYSIEASTELGFPAGDKTAEGVRVMADSKGAATLTAPAKTGTAVFFRTLVNAADNKVGDK